MKKSFFIILTLFVFLLGALYFYISYNYKKPTTQGSENRYLVTRDVTLKSVEDEEEISRAEESQEKSYLYADYNFDGFEDRAAQTDCGATGNCNYRLELYNPDAKTFYSYIDNGDPLIGATEFGDKSFFVRSEE